jgi:hypothetical protein
MVHDCPDRIVMGAAVTWHDVSVANGVAKPETTVPTGPDVGSNVKVPTGPAITAKVAVPESYRPAFVSAVTVKTVPGSAPAATLKLPVSVPPAIVQPCPDKRPDGEDVRRHVVP